MASRTYVYYLPAALVCGRRQNTCTRLGWLCLANVAVALATEYYSHTRPQIQKTFIHNNRWTAATAKQAYHLETSILERLATVNPPTNCSKWGRLFPKLLSRNDTSLVMVTSFDGSPLNLKRNQAGLCQIPYCDSISQAKCMDAVLGIARVKHLDMSPNGKNMLINIGLAPSRLTLYDFDIAELDRAPSMQQFKSWQAGGRVPALIRAPG